MRTKISGVFILLFMVAAAFLAAMNFMTAVSKTESATWKTIMNGLWAPTFEKSLNESISLFNVSRDFWGATEYDLFGEGRKGVLVGRDGWLFTDEEFECVKDHTKNLEKNLSYITQVQKDIAAKGVKLVIAIVPSKARVYKEYLGNNIVPSCRENVYSDIITHLNSHNITTVNILENFIQSDDKDALYLKTDTHWTGNGARLAAKVIADNVPTDDLTAKSYDTSVVNEQPYEGDLLRYLPGVSDALIKPDMMQMYQTEEAVIEDNAEHDDSASALALFGDDIPPVTLVGTSYSANQTWNFHGFLKDALDVDVLNMADEGLGPFSVMKTYLENDAWTQTSPSVVIWEIPERYVPTKTAFLYK